MHDHENTGSQKPRPSLQCQVGRVVDVPEVDADECGAAAYEEIKQLRLDVRPGLPIPGRPPALVPAVRMTALSLTVSLSSSSASAPGREAASAITPGMPATAASGIRLRSSPSSKR